MRIILFVVCIFFSLQVSAQEILANVKVDYSQLGGSNPSTYQALEKSLKDFINNTSWGNAQLKPYERIEANFTIVLQQKEGSNKYKASILVQSRRPVFKSGYHTPVLNLNDNNFGFEYTDFEQLIFNPRKFSNKNLTDVLAYYIYMILGYDADTFSKKGGTAYFRKAQEIANNAQSSNFEGWSAMQGPRSRLSFVNEVLSSKNDRLRDLYYDYHRNGLDRMSNNELSAKNKIGESLQKLSYYAENNNYTQNYPLDIFLQAKKGEIKQIFTGGLKSTFGLPSLVSTLNTISPSNAETWNKLNK